MQLGKPSKKPEYLFFKQNPQHLQTLKQNPKNIYIQKPFRAKINSYKQTNEKRKIPAQHSNSTGRNNRG